jgi:hypothetical protein
LEHDWGSVFEKFPSSGAEVKTGLDCYAFGDAAGCVFHMMRVAELGVRTLARERGITSVRKNIPIKWANWQEVIDAINHELTAIRAKPRGPKKDAALSFYETVLSDLRALQAVYRNPTMHFREAYHASEALNATFRVKSLMTMLATKLNETKPRRIRWGL